MIKELNRNNKTNWYEKIQIELTLADLQAIYDCLGGMPYDYIKIKHKVTPYQVDYRDILADLYGGLDKIISEHNGITDDNPMITEVDVEIIGEN